MSLSRLNRRRVFSAAPCADPSGQLDFAALLFPPPPIKPLPPALVPVYRVKLVKCGSRKYHHSRAQVNCCGDVAPLLADYLRGLDREHLVVLLLDIQNRLIGAHTASVGDLNSAVVHPREIFKPAILASAAGIVLAHNHPSGDPTPSSEDIAITRRLGMIGDTLGIEVMDHVILGDQGRWVSLRELGLYGGPALLEYRQKLLLETTGPGADCPSP